MSMYTNELELNIVKTSFDKKTGEYRWQAQASSTDLDLDAQRTSVELYKSFIAKIEGGMPIRVEDRLKDWEGPMPYLSVSHFTHKIGEATSLYIDGKYLKAKGVFADNDIGSRAYKSVSKSTAIEEERPIRISISWRDLAHKHEKTGDVYDSATMGPVCPFCATQGTQHIKFLDGQIIHLALTRMPANRNTSIQAVNGVEKMGDYTQKQKEDAASIVGDDIAEEISQQEIQKIHEDTASIVTKSEEEEPAKEEEEPAEKTASTDVEETVEKADKKDSKKKEDEEEEESEKESEKEDDKDKKDEKEKMATEPDEFSLAIAKFTEIVRGDHPDLEAHRKAVNEGYQELNAVVEKVAKEAHQIEKTEHVSDQQNENLLREKITADLTQHFDKRFQALQNAITKTIQDSVGNVNAVVTGLPEKKEEKTAEEKPPVPISAEFRPPVLNKAVGAQEKQSVSQFRRIANKTTGLPVETP